MFAIEPEVETAKPSNAVLDRVKSSAGVKTMKRPVVVIIDDQRENLDLMREFLEPANYALYTYDDPTRALECIAEHGADVLITDMQMPRIDGFQVLQTVHARLPQCKVIILTGYGCIEDAVRAIKYGATDFLTKPINFRTMTSMVERLVSFQINAETAPHMDEPVSGGKQLTPIMALAARAAESTCSVLLTGETGVGKEVIADYVHAHSPRQPQPYVKINCAALSETLIESELFGYEQGAFTGAAKRHMGRFERANRGTVFLDEIGELSPAMQTKLLRVLQTKEVERVGGNETIKVDFRLISATHRDLEKMIAEGKFRQDLYYRINTVPIHLPPLRQRRDEIPALARTFVQRNALKLRNGPEEIDDAALALLQAYAWPGNIRELENCLERACLLGRDRVLRVADLWWLNVSTPPARESYAIPAPPAHNFANATPQAAAHQPAANFAPEAHLTPLEQSELQTIKRVLDENGWNYSRAAVALNVSRSTLYLKASKYGIHGRRSHAAAGQ